MGEAHVVKLSDEELQFLTGSRDPAADCPQLPSGPDAYGW